MTLRRLAQHAALLNYDGESQVRLFLRRLALVLTESVIIFGLLFLAIAASRLFEAP